MIELDHSICSDFEAATSREWLETNGIGGFASGTVSGANSRRYHGILTAATKPPLGRLTLVSKLEETLIVGGRPFELSANRFPGAVSPEGFRFIKSFRLDPFPVWRFEIGDVVLEKRILMADGENTTVCRWELLGHLSDCRLVVRPLLAFTDYHALRRETGSIDTNLAVADGLVAVRPFADAPEVAFAHNAGTVTKTAFWYRNFEYAIEEERGFDFHEDLFQPFALEFDLGETASVIVSTERRNAADAGGLEAGERERRRKLAETAGEKGDFERALVLAADQFIVRRGTGRTVIAGYPWFSDWGRDTMIALPGLALATGRPEIARDILLEFSRHFSDGMLPNRFPDAGDEAEYNTVDATLWYFEAVRAYLAATDDEDFVRINLYEKLAESVAWHVRGTRFHIRLDDDGLLAAGTAGVQLTWMDAKIGDWVVTPRLGKPVEIQALWYNALRTMSGLARSFGDLKDRIRYDELAAATRRSFDGKFWNDEEQCLFDVVADDGPDASVRPNQIFAVSLFHPVLVGERAAKVVRKVESELLTPVGLRSLSPRDPGYRPVYRGSPFERDSAYHQGTVWAWPIGAFIDAFRRVSRPGAETERRVAAFLKGFERHLSDAGLGQISEIFDADPPHAPRGCPAQAWSVAEVLRVVRDSRR